MTRLRLGLIGLGRWGRTLVRTLNETPDVDLARTASRGPRPPDIAGADCRHFTDWRESLDPEAIDGVIIATPPAVHAEMAIEALRRHIPVFVEKPLTMKLREAQDVQNAARANNTLIMVDHTHLFSPAYRELKNQIGNPDTIRALHCISGNMGPFRSDVPVLWDWGSHDIALCMDLLGFDLNCRLARYLEHRNVDGAAGELIELHLESDMSVPIHMRVGNIMQPKTRFFAVYLEDSLFIYDDQSVHKLKRYEATSVFSPPPGTGAIITVENEPPLKNALIEFRSAIRSGDTQHVSLDLGIAVVAALEKCEAMLPSAGGYSGIAGQRT
ncbi:MAG TPA: Gfo/Idh/MocA family oxidoreductase [Gammaproteobacteria bacterium]|nr:Gfo/Idh/MocA family oxidoreductase [Gammaproteobacteria bacterium]